MKAWQIALLTAISVVSGTVLMLAGAQMIWLAHGSAFGELFGGFVRLLGFVTFLAPWAALITTGWDVNSRAAANRSMVWLGVGFAMLGVALIVLGITV